jgi:hypothetical protein
MNKFPAKKIVGSRHTSSNIFENHINSGEFAINDKWNNMNKMNNMNKWIYNDHKLYLKDDEFIKNKKLISISPGGFNGFYMLGTSAFIKEKYVLDNYIFSGASAGAWNSLFMTFKQNPHEFIADVLDEKLHNSISIIDLEYAIKYKILNKYTDNDFDLKKLFIGVTSFENMKVTTHIFSNFNTLEDALNCCIASSHIPYITGTSFLNKYKNMNAFDGGFSKYPYLNVIEPSLHITPSIWKENGVNTTKNCIEKLLNLPTRVSKYATGFSMHAYNFTDLFDMGYNDAKKNKDFLDSIFI